MDFSCLNGTMAEPQDLRVLLVDDDANDRALSRLVLDRELPVARCREAVDAGSFASEVAAGRFDVVVVDVDLHWASRLEVLQAIQNIGLPVPVIAFTANTDARLVVEGMRSGFRDWIFKDSEGWVRLPRAIERAWIEARTKLLVARSEPWLGTLLEKANLAVYRTTIEGQLIESTPALLRLLGVKTVEEALDVHLPKPHFETDENGLPTQAIDGEQILQSRQVTIQKADGAALHLNLTEVMLLDVDGELVIDVLAQDITPFKHRQTELESCIGDLERSNADLSQFAYIASHELQEPLRMVEKFGGILAEDYAEQLGSEGESLLQSMVDGADRMQVLIDDLLALSRIDTEGHSFEEVDCDEVVERARHLLDGAIEESSAVIDVEPLPTVVGDESQLIQLWQNLLSNALKFRGEEPPRVHISAAAEDHFWKFSIEDNGIGVDDDRLVAIFEIFRRLHPELPGTGIGLTICMRIVERHGGRIWAESMDGPGTRFCFTLPRVVDEETPGGQDQHESDQAEAPESTR